MRGLLPRGVLLLAVAAARTRKPRRSDAAAAAPLAIAKSRYEDMGFRAGASKVECFRWGKRVDEMEQEKCHAGPPSRGNRTLVGPDSKFAKTSLRCSVVLLLHAACSTLRAPTPRAPRRALRAARSAPRAKKMRLDVW